jgi:SAM-dependent methyltransferase
MKNSLVDGAAVERLLLFVGALRSGLIDTVATEEGLTAEEVAEKAGTHPRATRVVLEALAVEGVVERLVGRPDQSGEGALYRLSPVGRAHFVDDGPDLERFGLMHQVNKLVGWLDLPEVIRTGRPVPRDPARRDIPTMVSAMGERDPAALDEIVERILAYAGPVRTMLDVGGAVGHVARHFSRCGVRATVFDRESVLPMAQEFLGDEAGDIALVGGDFTESLPVGPFDLVYLGNVSHIYGPATNARVIQEAHSLLSPGGSIAIQDHVWGRSPRAALFAVNMLQATEEGGVWAESQYRDWLGGAGFVNIEVMDLDTTRAQLVLGRRRKI